MSKFVFAAVILVACYSAYRALIRSVERQQEMLARARSRRPNEPRDLGHLRETDNGVYVPDEQRRY